MPCSSCGGVSGSSSQLRAIVQQVQESLEPCSYTQENLSSWLIALNCVKTKGLYTNFSITSQKLNSYLGIVQSAVNYSTNPCYFRIKLDEIKIVIDNIQNSGQC